MPAGRKAKPALTDEEARLALEILAGAAGKGTGMRAAAQAISKGRLGPYTYSPQAIAKRSVSARWLAQQLTTRGEMPQAAKLRIAQRRRNMRRNSDAAANPGSRNTPGMPTGDLGGAGRAD